jgi:hypothetical protein
VALAQAGAWPATIAPRVTPLADPLVHAWTRGLDLDDARLAPIGDGLWLAGSDGRLLELGADVEPSSVLAPGGFRPAVDSDPVYVTAAGEVGRWAPAAGWRPVWSAGLEGAAVDALGLPGERVLVSSSEWPDGLRLIDERRSSVVWSAGAVAPWMLAVANVVLGWRAGGVDAIDLAGGGPLWSRRAGFGVVALSDATAWLANGSEGLVEVAADTGSPAGRARLPGGVPSFALTPDGLLYAVGRPLEVVVLDLFDGMAPVVRREYPDVALRGTPRVVALATGERLLVVTADAVLELRPERDDAVRELWRTDELIVDAEAGGEAMAVITIDDAGGRRLTLFGA